MPPKQLTRARSAAQMHGGKRVKEEQTLRMSLGIPETSAAELIAKIQGE